MAVKDVILKFRADDSGLKSGLNSMKGGLGALKVVGVAAFAAMAAAAVKFSAEAIKAGAAFESSMTEARAVSRATQAQYESMSAKAREIGAATAFSAQEAADSFIGLSRAGLSTEQQIQSIDAVMALAGATATDLTTSTEAIVASLSQFNLEATESARVADTFAAAAANSMFDTQGLAVAMRYAGTTGAAMGMSLEETTAAVMQFRNLGLEASQAGTSLRMALNKLANITPNAESALASYGLTAADVSIENKDFGQIIDTLAKAGVDAGAAMQIFGARAGSSMAGLIKNAREGSNEYEKFLSTLEDSSGTAEEMYDTMMDTVQGQMDIVKSAAEEVKLSWFDALQPTVKGILPQISGLLTKIGNVIKNNTSILQDFFRHIVAAFSAFETGAGDAQIFETIVKGVFSSVAIAVGGFVAAIGGVKVAWETVKLAFNLVADGITGAILGIISIVKNMTATIANAIVSTFEFILDRIATDIERMAKVAGVFSDDLESKLNNAANSVRNAADGARETVKNLQADAELAQEAVAIHSEESSLRFSQGMYEIEKASEQTRAGFQATANAVVAANQITIDSEGKKQEAIKETANLMNQFQSSGQTLDSAMQAGGTAGTKPQEEGDSYNMPMPTAAEFTAMAEAAKPMNQQFTILGQNLGTIKETGQAMFSSLSNGITNMVMSVATGTKSIGESIGSFFIDLGKSVLKMLTQIVAKMAAMKIFSLLGGLGTGGIFNLFTAAAQGIMHTGGTVPETGNYRLLRGETVLPTPTYGNRGQGANRQATTAPAESSKVVNITIPNTSEKETFKRVLRPGGALSQAFEELGAKVLLNGG